MSQSMHGSTTIHTPRKHIVPTHLNLPDQVLTLWSFSLSARQLLLLLVGAGIGGTVWQHLAILGHHALVGQALRLLVALVPFLLLTVLACYQYAGRYLEVWLIVLARYLRPVPVYEALLLQDGIELPHGSRPLDPPQDAEIGADEPTMDATA